jgi:hypothetical protein
LEKRDEKLVFEIAAEDHQLQAFLCEIEQGCYGFDERGWEWFFERLPKLGYGVEVINKDAYRITKEVAEKYQQRIVRTLPRYIQPRE